MDVILGVSLVDYWIVFSVKVLTKTNEHNNPINHDWIGGAKSLEHAGYASFNDLLSISLDE
jgi:hypothetical protein